MKKILGIMKARARRRIKKYVFSRDKSRFVRVFELYNKLISKKKISVKTINGLLRVIDGEHEVYLTYPKRVKLYLSGIDKRLEKLYREYLVDNIPFDESDLVIDIGANIGEFSLYLQNRFGVSTIAIEPEDHEYEALKKNIGGNKSHIYNSPLWKESSQMDFYSANYEGDSSLFASSENLLPTKKQTKTLEELLDTDEFFQEKKRIKLLKVEAEGAEPEILQGSTNILEYVQYITVDCGPERGIKKENTLIDVYKILDSHGFTPLRFGLPRVIMLFGRKNA